jgi:TRAP-type C4-dicarboxylate transport system permease small subunit
LIKICKNLDMVLEKILRSALILLVAAMVLLAFWQVLCRYIILISVPYAEELARLAIVWCIYLGAALGVRHNEHINVTALIDASPRWLKMILKVISFLFIILFAGVLLIYGSKHVASMANDFTTSLGYHRYWFFVPNIVGGALIVIYAAANLIIYFKDFFSSNDGEDKGDTAV